MKWILVFALMMGPTFAYADADVPANARPRNQRGNCVWCAFETIFYGAAGYEQARGATKGAIEQGWSGAGPHNVVAYCERDKIPYETVRDLAGYRKACDAGLGVVLFIPRHAVALVGIDDKEARIIDNNGSPEVQRWPLAKFQQLAQQGICPTCPSPSRPQRPSAPTPNNPGPPVPTGPAQPVTPAVDLKPILDQLAALAAKVEAIKLQPGPQGPPGAPGAKGEPGAAGAQGDLAPLLAEMAKLQSKITVLETRITHVEAQGSGRFRVSVTRVPQ